MRVPERLEALLDMGVIDEVIRPLQSGKEAQVYLVTSRGLPCVAKVYKEPDQRSFKNRADYIEGRKVRGSREQRAMDKKTKFGKQQVEDAWRATEVETIYRLAAAGVRVPEPLDFVDGVLVMERIVGDDGEPAPRLCDVTLSADEARELFNIVLNEVIRMLCAGIVHGDLSDFNILLSETGPVIIDFPQAIDASASQGARRLLVRDVRNLTHFFGRHDPEIAGLPLGEEMWALYERAELHPDTVLTGKWKGSDKKADVSSLLEEIETVEREARQRREALGLPVRPARAPGVAASAPIKPLRPGRGPQDRGPQDRGHQDRGPQDRGPRDRPPQDRGSAGRGPNDRPSHDRPPPPRAQPPRAALSPMDDLDALLMVEGPDPDAAPKKKRRRRR